MLLHRFARLSCMKYIRRVQSVDSFGIGSDIKSKDLQVILTDSPSPKPDTDSLVFGKVLSDHMLHVEWNKGYGWNPPIIKPCEKLHMHPAAGALQYGGQIYEGMKAFYGVDKKIRIFRPDQNVARFCRSAARMCLPVFDESELLRCIIELVQLERDWIPQGDGCSLYIRPSLISLDTYSGDQDINRALLFVILSPVGSYFKGGTMQPVSLLADPNYVRACPGGTGECKAGGNYGPTIFLQKEAEKKGCNQTLWLYNNEVTEAGTMNMFMHWINENGEEELITPPLDTLILRGITRQSIVELAEEWDEFLVSERKFTMKDILKASKENRIQGIFAVGTAPIVCPIGSILYEEQWIKIPCEDMRNSLAKRFYDALRDIQYGRTPHMWAPIIS